MNFPLYSKYVLFSISNLHRLHELTSREPKVKNYAHLIENQEPLVVGMNIPVVPLVKWSANHCITA